MSVEPAAFIVVTQRESAQLTSAMQRLLAALRDSGGHVVVAGAHIDPRSAGVAVSASDWIRSATADPLMAYAAGVRSLDRELPWTRIVLLDDSVVALNPGQLLGTLAAAPGLDVASLTMMSRPQPHLHAGCMVFQGPQALQRGSFFDWWGQAEGISERALTDHFAAAGLRVGSMFQPDRAQCILAVCRALAWGVLPLEVPASGPYRGDPDAALGLDPRVFLWDELMARYGVLSVELLRDPGHPANLVLLRNWLAANPAAAGIIEQALLPPG